MEVSEIISRIYVNKRNNKPNQKKHPTTSLNFLNKSYTTLTKYFNLCSDEIRKNSFSILLEITKM